MPGNPKSRSLRNQMDEESRRAVGYATAKGAFASNPTPTRAQRLIRESAVQSKQTADLDALLANTRHAINRLEFESNPSPTNAEKMVSSGAKAKKPRGK